MGPGLCRGLRAPAGGRALSQHSRELACRNRAPSGCSARFLLLRFQLGQRIRQMHPHGSLQATTANENREEGSQGEWQMQFWFTGATGLCFFLFITATGRALVSDLHAQWHPPLPGLPAPASRAPGLQPWPAQAARCLAWNATCSSTNVAMKL